MYISLSLYIYIYLSLSLSLYIYIYIYMYTYAHTYVVYIHISCISLSLSLYIYIYIHIYLSVYPPSRRVWDEAVSPGSVWLLFEGQGICIGICYCCCYFEQLSIGISYCYFEGLGLGICLPRILLLVVRLCFEARRKTPTSWNRPEG